MAKIAHANAEQTTQQTTASATYVDVIGTSTGAFTPGEASDWLIETMAQIDYCSGWLSEITLDNRRGSLVEMGHGLSRNERT